MSIRVWENGRIVSKSATFLKAGDGPANKRRLRDPLARPLSKRQLCAAIILAGISDPDAFMEEAAMAISDETERALALNDWRYARSFEREHSLLNNPDILAAAGFTSHDVDNLWASAAQQNR